MIKWFKFHVLGIGKCKHCHGSGDSDRPFGDSELLGERNYFPCDYCHGTGKEEEKK